MVLWILVTRWMMDVNICVVIIDHNNPTTICNVIHVLWAIMLLLLRGLIALLLRLQVINVVLVKRLFGHTNLIWSNSSMLSSCCRPLWPSSCRRNIWALMGRSGMRLLSVVMHAIDYMLIILNSLVAFKCWILERGTVLSHDVALHLVGWLILKCNLPSVMACL